MRHYTFPVIRTIEDVLPHIEGRSEFIVVEKDAYTVINYVIQSHDTFVWDDEDPIGSAVRRECRGLIFDEDGELLSRRYHKFFNLNENEEMTETEDTWRGHYATLDKLDGSMISPLVIRGHVRWGTKMGITDVALTTERFIARSNLRYVEMAEHCHKHKMTPIFEWCSSKNRIVLEYPDQLVLTAVRYNQCGNYMSHLNLEHYGRKFRLPVVKRIPNKGHVLTIDARTQEELEGWVVRFDNGHMVKVKTPWYVQLHRIVSQIDSPRQIVIAVFGQKVDDILAALAVDKERANKFKKDTDRVYQELADDVIVLTKQFEAAYKYHNGCKKSFAIETAPDMDIYTRSILFKCWDLPDTQPVSQRINDAYCRVIQANMNKDKKFKELQKHMLRNINV